MAALIHAAHLLSASATAVHHLSPHRIGRNMKIMQITAGLIRPDGGGGRVGATDGDGVDGMDGVGWGWMVWDGDGMDRVRMGRDGMRWDERG